MSEWGLFLTNVATTFTKPVDVTPIDSDCIQFADVLKQELTECRILTFLTWGWTHPSQPVYVKIGAHHVVITLIKHTSVIEPVTVNCLMLAT